MVHSAPNITVNVYPVMPPAREIGKRCLAQLQHGGDKKEAPGLHRLLDAWVDMHHPIRHEESPPIAPLPPDLPVFNGCGPCQRAGTCTCSEAKRDAAECQRLLWLTLKKLCVKKSPGRAAYDAGKLVARVSSDNPDDRVLWFFIGFGN